MSTLLQIIQAVENQDELSFTEIEWKQCSNGTRWLLESGVDQGYFERADDRVAVGEGDEERMVDRCAFRITPKGKTYMQIARGEIEDPSKPAPVKPDA